MRGQLFEYAVLYHPKIQPQKALEALADTEIETAKSVLLVKPASIMALSDDEVRTMAARDIPEEYTAKLDQIEILVRPFAP